MAFPPTRSVDINTWMPYAGERIGPFVPSRLFDAHFYTLGPHLEMHHPDFVILQQSHEAVLNFHCDQIRFWQQTHRQIGKLMHMLQFYHHHMQHQNIGDSLPTDFIYGNIDSRAQEAVQTVGQAVRYLKRHHETPVWLKNQMLFEAKHAHPCMPKIARRHSF